MPLPPATLHPQALHSLFTSISPLTTEDPASKPSVGLWGHFHSESRCCSLALLQEPADYENNHNDLESNSIRLFEDPHEIKAIVNSWFQEGLGGPYLLSIPELRGAKEGNKAAIEDN